MGWTRVSWKEFFRGVGYHGSFIYFIAYGNSLIPSNALICGIVEAFICTAPCSVSTEMMCIQLHKYRERDTVSCILGNNARFLFNSHSAN